MQEIITKNLDPEFLSIVEPLIQTEMVQDLKLYRHHKVNSRYYHCLEVAYITYKLAKKYKLDYKAAARAGLLHDLFHYDTKKDKHIVTNHYEDHPKIAVLNARQITKLTEKEEQMILTHMWQPVGKYSSQKYRPKSQEGWLLTMVDKHCALKDVSYYKFKTKKTQKILTLADI